MKFIANHEATYFTPSTCTHKRRESLVDRVFALLLFFDLSVVAFLSLSLPLLLTFSFTYTHSLFAPRFFFPAPVIQKGVNDNRFYEILINCYCAFTTT